MAISTPTAPLNSFNVANTNPYDTAAVVLTAGRHYFMVVHAYSTSPSDAVSSISHDPLGTPLAFARVTDGTVTANVDPWDVADHRTLEVWRVKPASTTANALIRITWAASQSACGWTLVEIATGVDETTPIVQVVKASGAAGKTASVTMAAFVATDNLALLVVANGTGTAAPGEAFTATEGRTELAENNETERADHAIYYQNPHGGDTTLNATWTNNEDWAAIGIEIKAAVTGYTLTAATGAFALTGNAANLLYGRVVGAATGAFALTGNAATLQKNTPLVAATGAFVETGNDANLLYGRVLSSAAGAFALTGNNAGLFYGRVVGAGVGSFVLTGNAANLIYTPGSTYTLVAATGAFALTGNAAGLLVGRAVTAATGAFALAGNAANLLYGRVVSAATGAFVLTGNDANLIPPARQFTLVAETGSFVLTGNDANLNAERRGTLFGVGPADLKRAAKAFEREVEQEGKRLYRARSETGRFRLVGTRAKLLVGRRPLVAEAGQFMLRGREITFLRHYRMKAVPTMRRGEVDTVRDILELLSYAGIKT